MKEILLKIFQFLLSFWNNLPAEKKDELIQKIVLSFQDMLRRYYQQYKKQEGDNKC